jgi:GDP-4-dehydro-6-deoxy-D-mannose reductase
MKRVLVTGCGGFVGPYVVDTLVGGGYEVWGVDVRDRVENPSLRRYVSCDLAEKTAVDSVLEEASPEAVVHLAAQSSAGKSFREPFVTLTRNVLPILNILESARVRGEGIRVLAVGSGDVYGSVSEAELPLAEDRAPNPANPYALSKAIQEQCCVRYASFYGTDVVVTRSFNHTGGGQRDTFVLSSFARQVSEVRLGLKEPVVEVGDLDLKRDFTDVKDVARAYASILERGKRGEVYNVCSGTSHSLRGLLQRLCEMAKVDVEIRVDPQRVRPADVRDLRGDPSKTARDTGWRARVAIAETLESLLDFWTRALQEPRHRSP